MRTMVLSWRLVAMVCVSVSVGSAIAQTVSPEDDLRYARSLSRAFERAADRLEESVVHITTASEIQRYRRDIFGRRYRVGAPQMRQTGLGSGVIIDAEGLVVTNHHVAAQGERLVVRLHDGREVEAELVGSDEDTDLAVLRVEADGLVAAPFGDSDRLGVGEWVLAMGSPFGFDYTVTSGIVSAKGRSLKRNPREVSYEEFIQTDAAINPGNSGGPLINLEGEVVGINTAIISRTQQSAGLGFAIPSVVAQRVVESIVETGHVRRGYLGVYMADLTPERRRELGLSPEEGVEVTGVEEESPAERAGLRAGDILLKVNGRDVIGGLNRVRNLISLSRPGSEIAVQLLRDGERLVKRAGVTDRAAMFGYALIESLGVSVQPMTREMSRELGYRRHIPGVLVMEVASGGAGADAGIEVGDILTEVDGRQIEGVDDLRVRLSRSLGVTTIELVRGRMRGYVEVELE